MNIRPILVTGSHRSGTTWVGKMLASSPRVYYFHEPFTPHKICGIDFDNHNTNFKYWFTYVNKENEKKYIEGVNKTLNFQYDIKQEITRLEGLRGIKKFIRKPYHYFNSANGKKRPLFKDPIAFFSSEWLAERFDFQVVMLIRHPAAFVGSIKRLNWQFDFNQFLKQPALMKKYLMPFKNKIIEFSKEKKPAFEQAILLWNIFYTTYFQFQTKHKNWLFYRHRDIAVNPIKKYKEIFNRLCLDYTDEVEENIIEYSSEKNPVDVSKGTKRFPIMKINSKKSIYNFRKILSEEEIDYIKKRTKNVWRLYYDEKEWRPSSDFFADVPYNQKILSK